MNVMPGGGQFGRGARREVRNPVLLLPAAQGILALPVESRRPLGLLLRQLADQANDQAQSSWKSNKGIMAAYWKAVSVYAKHLARVIDPINARSEKPGRSLDLQAEKPGCSLESAPRAPAYYDRRPGAGPDHEQDRMAQIRGDGPLTETPLSSHDNKPTGE